MRTVARIKANGGPIWRVERETVRWALERFGAAAVSARTDTLTAAPKDGDVKSHLML